MKPPVDVVRDLGEVIVSVTGVVSGLFDLMSTQFVFKMLDEVWSKWHVFTIKL